MAKNTERGDLLLVGENEQLNWGFFGFFYEGEGVYDEGESVHDTHAV